ncbi:MAG: hypothetical protein E5Y32_16035 [Mesorhizobium sp.]|nr:MAG: hypothetical protein E5Y67_28335 [Mesorhizobium sp.]TIM44052.1 MAG: hypothetical protein E5Y56_16495 [Mesorhizobium sp.]TIN44612.1 MAG: hypothetical protein E5Y32_16035 [Mesorhizobium sp.]
MAHDPIDTLGKATRHNMLVKAECNCGNVRYCRYFFSGDPPGHRPLASGPRDPPLATRFRIVLSQCPLGG